MRSLSTLLLLLASATLLQAQSGPCTRSAIEKGNLSASEDSFSYMPPYGRPVIGNAEMKNANEKSFSGRTNIQRRWENDHRIVATPAGDMAYEAGTVRMSYDSKTEGRKEFEAVMLMVYKPKGGVCERVALTMQPLEPKDNQKKK